MNHKIKASWKDGMHFNVDAPGGEVNIDAAEDFGGQGKGNRAKPLMLTSLAGCTGVDVLSITNKMKIVLDDFWIEVDGELTEEHPKIYKSTHIKYHFRGKDLDVEKIERAVNLSFDKYCGVIAMFKQFSNVTKEINFVEA